MSIPDCDWYDVSSISFISDLEEFTSKVVEPFQKHGEYVSHAYFEGEIGDYIKDRNITKPQFEKTVLLVGLADNWTQAQGYWNQIWMENL